MRRFPTIPTAPLAALLLIGAACAPSASPDAALGIPSGGQSWTLSDDRIAAFRAEYDRVRGYSGVTEREARLVRSSDEWAGLWTQLGSIFQPAPERPEVDFSREMVVFVSMGEQSNGGHGISIREVRAVEGKLYVAVEETIPRNCVTTQAMVQPSDALPVPSSDAELVVVRTRRVYDCR